MGILVMMSRRPKSVKIIEVGPRDGLQNEKNILSTDIKLKYIELLISCGLKNIESTSFVRPDRIPQMSDARELFSRLQGHLTSDELSFPCLVPNLKGLESALACGVKEVALFSATSNTFNKKNINADIEESFDRLRPVAKKAQEHGLKIRAYISTVFGCPYEGKTSVSNLKYIVEKFLKLGAYEVSLGDTVGVGHPDQVKSILSSLKESFDLSKFAMHFHDTYSMALVNIMASLEEGITAFDSSSGGLGGCPYAHGASGNVATEDLVYLCNQLGIQTGVDLNKLIQASDYILSFLGEDQNIKQSPSKIYNVLKLKQEQGES